MFYIYDGANLDTGLKISAKEFIYKRTPSVWADGVNGWETISLPFDAMLYTKGSEDADFKDTDIVSVQESGDYWLREYKGVNAVGEVVFDS